MSIRLKMIAAFFSVAVAIALVATGLSYRLLRDSLTEEIRGRLGDIAYLGAAHLDLGATERLIATLSAPLDEAQVARVEQSTDYLRIDAQLQMIRAAEPTLIQFAYILVPGKDANTTRFLVDADVLAMSRKVAAGEKVEDEISHFGLDYDISDKRFIQQAFRTRSLVVENEFVPDPKYHTTSLSAYAPIRNAGGQMLGILGIDLKDENMRAALLRSAVTSAAIVLGALIGALAVSVLVGHLVTRGIRALDGAARQLSERKFDTRVQVQGRDEIGRLGESFNNMAQAIGDHLRHREALLRAYGRFVPHSFLEFLKKESVIDLQLGEHVQREMTVLFSDIRSFTSLSEKMTPQENFDFVNAFLRRVGPVIRDHGGVIDKYIGDAVMALFPGPPADALRAAIAMQRKVAEYNQTRTERGFDPIAIGVGLHTGTLILGTVGESERMNSTVISDAVNLASRLEGATKHYGVGIVISEATRAGLAPTDGFGLRYLDLLRVKGKAEPVAIYDLFDADPETRRSRKVACSEAWRKVTELYRDRRFDEALPILEDIAAQMPEDVPARMYLERVERFVRENVPHDWSAVEVMDWK